MKATRTKEIVQLYLRAADEGDMKTNAVSATGNKQFGLIEISLGKIYETCGEENALRASRLIASFDGNGSVTRDMIVVSKGLREIADLEPQRFVESLDAIDDMIGEFPNERVANVVLGLGSYSRKGKFY